MRHPKLPLPFFLVLTLFAFAGSVRGQDKFLMPGGGKTGFIENKGQIHDQHGTPNNAVKFLLYQGHGMNIQLRTNGFSYDTWLQDDSTGATKSGYISTDRNVRGAKRQKPGNFHFHRVDIEFLGANPSTELVPEQPLPFRFTYAKGTPSGPQNIRAAGYRKVTYRNIYPFIDLVFTINAVGTGKGTAEYDFRVHPGGNPNTIRWIYHGAIRTAIDGNHISLAVTKGEIRERIPKSYQPGRLVDVRYRSLASGAYSYQVARYDPTKELVIDPTPDLLWGTYYGEAGVVWLYSVARDSLGNVIFGGGGLDATNIATAGSYQSTLDGNSDGIVGKFDASGNLLWATYYGGSSYETIYGVAVDKQNNIYSFGNTFSGDGIATPGAFKTSYTAYAGCVNGYLGKFNTDGQLVWGTYYGGEKDDESLAVTVDHNNDVVVCGGTSSMTGIATPGAWQTGYADGPAAQQLLSEDIFLAKFNPNGGIVWSTYFGGTGFDRANAVAVDLDNNILLTGGTTSTTMSTPGSFQTQMDIPNKSSSLVSKFSPGGSLVWSTYFGKGGGQQQIGSTGGDGLGVAADFRGNVYVVGETLCLAGIATPGAFQTTNASPNQWTDGFLMKFDKTGTRELWGTYVGGISSDYANGVCTDGNNAVWITGIMGSQTNAITASSYQPTYTGAGDIFIVQFDSTGARQWGTYYGTSVPGYYGGEGQSVVDDGLGNVYAVGQVSATEGIATCGAYQSTPAYGVGFVAKFGQAVKPSVAIAADHNGHICPGVSVQVTANPQNAGSSPAYEWLLNGTILPGSGATISIPSLTSGDSVRCILVLNPACATGLDTSNSLHFQVDPELPPSVSVTTASDSICPGVPVTFSANGVNGGPQPSYEWLVNGVQQGTDSSGFTTGSLKSGDIVSCVLVHQGSCIIDSVASSSPIGMVVRQAPAMSIAITTDQNPVCSGMPVKFTATATAAAAFSYQWEVDGVATGKDSPTFSSSQLQDGDQILCLIKPQGGACAFSATSSDTISQKVYPTPDISITGDSLITRGQKTALTATVTGNGLTYLWTPDSSLSNATISNPVAFPTVKTTYLLTVTSAQGCSAQKAYTIEVIPKITIPNAFTPDGNGRNDVFRALYGSDISNVRVSVFDRVGQLLFTDRGTHQGWDGRSGGKRQPEGTYVWVFEYTDSTGTSRMLKGTVELIR